MSGRIGIRGLLLAVNAFALVMPLLAIVGLRVFDDQLIRRTEAQLIGQGVLIAETYREEWLRELQIPPEETPRYAPISAGEAQYFPIEPISRLGQGIRPPTAEPTQYAADRSGPSWRAGARMERVMRRAARMNLSSARVLDTQGCVVASSGSHLGACLASLPEVEAALAGRYASVLRHRHLETPPPPIESISRRGRVRVHIAIPVLADGEVIAVVRMARTAIDPAKALWFDRERLAVALGACALLTAALSLFLSHTIARPLRDITRAARSIARGEQSAPLDPPPLAATELREMSAALDQMTRQLSDRADYIAEFATHVSHELKTPITGIRGATELLEEEWDGMKPDERRRFLANIRGDAQRMERLVTRLLHLARIQSAPEYAEAIDPGAFLKDLCGSYGDAVTLRLDGLPSSISINPDHLESAVRNLVDNAIRHGAGQVVEVEAETEMRGDVARVIIHVRDRGPGISPSNQNRIFDRFFTTERDAGGTGLGLSIARAVAETRGGHLDFETGPDGTCFELVL
jgi:signal transduction histidine kinase